MNQTYHEQHYATGHQHYSVPASYNAQQLAAQQQAQANAAAMYRIHNQWRRDKEEQLKDVVWGALAPGMQQCVRDMAAKSDEHSQELRDMRESLTSIIASVSEKLHSFQESVVCQFGDLGADVQALKDEAQQMPRRFLSFEEDNERMRTSQECRDQELFARIDQLEKKMQLQSESILSCIQQLFEQAEIKNDQRQNKVMGMLGEVSAQNLSIQRYFSAPLSEPRMKTRSQGRRRSIGHELQDVPFVRAARDAVIKALKEDPSPRKLDKKDCPRCGPSKPKRRRRG
ncbi:hypothetical protein VCV18_012250 [Metarhizium anisopliae]